MMIMQCMQLRKELVSNVQVRLLGELMPQFFLLLVDWINIFIQELLQEEIQVSL